MHRPIRPRRRRLGFRHTPPAELSARPDTRPSGRRRASRAAVGELLEDRRLLAGDPVIAEFQADNVTTLKDRDGEYSDWIEIRNPAPQPVDLTGYYLTDDASDLRKWQLPSVTLAAGDELLVFASNKDRRDPSDELHTNFRLSAQGEYLALVKPDGVTISHDFAPAYPEQLPDNSYGLSSERESTEFIDEAMPLRAIVPSGEMPGDWTSTTFDDRDWPLSGTQGLGYEQLGQRYTQRADFAEPLGAEWTVDLPAGSAGTVAVADGALKLVAPDVHDFGTTRGLAPLVYRELPSGANDWEAIAEIERTVNVGSSGIALYDVATGKPVLQLEYNLRRAIRTAVYGRQVASTSIGELSALFLRIVYDDHSQVYSTYYKLAANDDWTLATQVKPTDDSFPVATDPRLGLYARSGTREVETDFASFEIIVPDEPAVYGPRIGTDVTAAMYQQNSSIYARIPFTVTESPASLDELVIRAAADDGFRAFLNGQDVTSRNVPIGATWDSAASSEQGAIRGRIPVEQIDVSAALATLRVGTNILALQGMNVAADDDDFFLSVTLTGSTILSTAPQYFFAATPGLPNVLPAAPRPQLVGADGIFFGSRLVELTLSPPQPSPDLVMHYTLDGSLPTLDSPRYTEPIALTASALLQARTFDLAARAAFEPSPLMSATFFGLADELRTRTSDLPLVILDTLGQGIPGTVSTTSRRTAVLFLAPDPVTGRATIENGVIDYLGRGGIRDRGSSTGGQAKPNLAFETWGPNGVGPGDDYDVSLAGLAADSDWVLHAPLEYDRAFIRNQFAFSLGNQMGHWAPHTQPVEVYLNRRGIVGEDDYHGLYVLIERIKPDPNRLPIAELTPQDNSEPDITGGYIFKFDRVDPDAPAGPVRGSNWVYPKSPLSSTARDDQKATAAQEQWVTAHFAALEQALVQPDMTDPEGYSKYIDIDSFVDNHLLNTFMQNVDAFALSSYFFKDRGEKIQMGPLWDFDRSMESTDDRDDTPLKWGGSGNSNYFDRAWYPQLFRDVNFWQHYVDRWHEWRKTVLSDDNLNRTIDAEAALVAESSPRNTTKWRQSRSRFGTWEHEIEHMRKWLMARTRFIDDNFAPNTVVSLDGRELSPLAIGQAITAGQEIEITPALRETFHDRVLLSGEPGAVNGSFLIPVDDELANLWTSPEFDDTSWLSGPMGIGYSNTTAFDDVIRTEVRPANTHRDATNVLTRLKFQVDDLQDLDALVLRLKFDDGVEVFLNGTQIFTKGIFDPTKWNSRALIRSNLFAVEYDEVDISEWRGLLRNGENVLAIRLVNDSRTGADLLLAAELVTRSTLFVPRSTGTVYYTTDGSDPRGPDGQPTAQARIIAPGEKLRITENTRIVARNFDPSDRGPESKIVRTNWGAPTTYNFQVELSPLVISEINYHPTEPTATELTAMPGVTAEDFEFVELHNPSDRPASLVGPALTRGIEFDLLASGRASLSAGEYAVVVANSAAFRLRYGDGPTVLGQFTGTLNNNGETLTLNDGTGARQFEVAYGDNDPWPVRADGVGGTLELRDVGQTPVDQQSKYYRWQASSIPGGTPSTANSQSIGVVINEVLANPTGQPTSVDAIELYNSTASPLDLSGWYLSDSASEPFKYRLPVGTTLLPSQYLVIRADQFNAPNDPRGFGLSGSEGDDLWLVASSATGDVARFVDDVHFGPTRAGESLGRVPDGIGRLAPMTELSLGSGNAAPRVGPVVITELQYQSASPSAAALTLFPAMTARDLEYLELHNATAEPVDLSGWRIRGGVDLDWTTGSLAAGETLLVLPFNPASPANAARTAAFRAHYGLSDTVRLLGGYSGRLSNAGDRVELLRIGGDPTTSLVSRPRSTEDEVLYDTLGPWPVIDASLGQSLQRTAVSVYGNAAASWRAAAATPGYVDFIGTRGDFDRDGQVTDADIDRLFEQLRSPQPDLRFDLTGDQRVDRADRDALVHDVLGTQYGDATLDGEFSSEDLVRIFQAGEYEDLFEQNSSWTEGDFNGDGDVTTADLVLAFQDGWLSPAAMKKATGGRLLQRSVGTHHFRPPGPPEL